MKTILSFLRTKYLAILWTIIIFVLCSLPSEKLPDVRVSDKFSHFAVFAIFAFLWLIPTKKIWLVLIAGASYGLLIEFWQGSLPENFHRSYDLLDAAADTTGTILGVIIFQISKRFLPF